MPALHPSHSVSFRPSNARIRMRLYFPQNQPQETIVSHLIQHGLTINVIKVSERRQGQVDLEMRGTIAQIHNGLNYLESLNLTIKGKPNPDGDGWYY